MSETLHTLEEQMSLIEAQLNALLRRRKELTPLLEAHRAVKRLEDDIAAGQELGLPATELSELRAELQQANEALKRAMLPQDPNDSRSVIMELRAGTGGE